MIYRRDIDGLRAVAVIPVVLYHLGIGAFSGGFVGVDIFFVISGFLITSLIHSDLKDNRFSIVTFYERRIRRIFPALFAVILFTVVIGCLILLPTEFRNFGTSVGFSSLFVSNVFFWDEAGYFTTAAELKPLLHLWSLAVEEQFYIVFPVLLYLIYRFAGRRFLVVIVPAAVLSFLLCVYATPKATYAAFYLLPTRAWELGLGALLALGAFAPIKNLIAREAAAVIGAALILGAVFGFNQHIEFPGAWALIPCAGAALLIYAGMGEGTTWTSRLLASAPFVFFGLISYSLYLWHWPMIAYLKYWQADQITAVEAVVVAVLSVLAAAASWKFIEQPVRTRKVLGARGPLFAAAAVAIVAGVGFAGFAAATQGWAGRFSDQAVAAIEIANDVNPKDCIDLQPQAIRDGNVCTIGAAGAPLDTLVWGDSHAWAMQHLISAALADKREGAYFISEGGCIPLFGIERLNHAFDCLGASNAVEQFVAAKGIKRVVIVSRWTPYYQPITSLRDGESKAVSNQETIEVIDRNFRATVERLLAANIEVVVFDPLPGAAFNVPIEYAKELQFGKRLPNLYTADQFLKRNEHYFASAAELEDMGVKRVQIWKDLCRSGICEVVRDHVPLYFDDNHPARDNFAFSIPLIEQAL